MLKNKFNDKFRKYARTLSPKSEEQSLISNIYQSFNDLLGANNCIQIGSYPRFTAITPVHDLDILYFLGGWNKNSHNPTTSLQNLSAKISKDYKNPTNYKIEVSTQTHSITVSYSDDDEEIFAVDIVPAYVFSKNEFGEDAYRVPEIIKRHGKKRVEYYQKLAQEHKEVGWIVSDPRGYIKIASQTDESTEGEFRKTVKIVKAWKNGLANADPDLKLKSFHLEQVITKSFQADLSLKIFDVIFDFFVRLPEIIDAPNQIKDRINNDKFVDDYLVDFTNEQKEKIKSARDGFLIKLEKITESDSIDELMEIDFYQRQPSEQFLYDFGIRTLTDDGFSFKIDGEVLPLPGFSAGWLTTTPQFQKGLTCGGQKTRKIKFSIRSDSTNGREYRWKVRNSDGTAEPRGEITIDQTKNNPESTQFPSNSYVECYAIENRVCVAKARVNVKII